MWTGETTTMLVEAVGWLCLLTGIFFWSLAAATAIVAVVGAVLTRLRRPADQRIQGRMVADLG